jgi:signal transduction histidine kinase/ActR/RegA family two-component response regulator
MVIPAGRSPRPFSRIAGRLTAFAAQFPQPFKTSRQTGAADQRARQVSAAQTRLLYHNGPTGVVVTVVVASVLAYFQWRVVPHVTVVAWLAYMLLTSAGRMVLVRRYWHASPSEAEHRPWRGAFALGAGISAIGWGAAGIVLYPAARSMNEVFLIFVLGGIMLGAASTLAARPEAFLTFLIPTGALPTFRLAIEGDQEHLMMAILTGLFTAATVSTTWRFHRTIESSIQLGFENQALVESLQTAKNQAEALNRDLELRVRERTTRLLEADQRKDEFLATLAHELRNPLAPIRFALEGLKPDAPAAIADRAHDVIERQVGQLVRLVDDLLVVSRITANKIHLRRESHALGRLMATAAESVMPLARAADHTLDVQLPSASIWVNADPTRLVQVFANILNNAVKFTPHGGHIWFTAGQDGNQAVVRIRDNGIGIASDVLPRVFDMFKQAEPILERSSGGLGVGLTLARRLVEMHEGRIDIRSEGPGQGTEIEIRLPLTTTMAAKTTEPERPGAAAPRSFRVLIVDDNVDAAEMLHLLLSGLGHTTKLAHDGAAALTAAAEFAPDVIFLDVGLPVINGYVVARRLRELPEFNHVHIAAVTGWGQDEDRRRAREAGFDSHFTKPLSPAALEELLARIALGVPPSADPFGTPRTRLTDSGRAS